MNKRALRIAIPIVLFAVAAAWAQQAPAPTPAPPAPEQAPTQAGKQGTIVRNVNLVDVLFSVVTKREKRGCTFCRKARIVTAPASARIIDKGQKSQLQE